MDLGIAHRFFSPISWLLDLLLHNSVARRIPGKPLLILRFYFFFFDLFIIVLTGLNKREKLILYRDPSGSSLLLACDGE